jgi:hypothetical protein
LDESILRLGVKLHVNLALRALKVLGGRAAPSAADTQKDG